MTLSCCKILFFWKNQQMYIIFYSQLKSRRGIVVTLCICLYARPKSVWFHILPLFFKTSRQGLLKKKIIKKNTRELGASLKLKILITCWSLGLYYWLHRYCWGFVFVNFESYAWTFFPYYSLETLERKLKLGKIANF